MQRVEVIVLAPHRVTRGDCSWGPGCRLIVPVSIARDWLDSGFVSLL